MVISNKDAIFNDDASWTKTNVCLSVVLKKYKLNDNESTILRIIIDVYNRAVLTFQKSEKKKETSISYDGLAEIMGVTKRTVYNAIQSLLDKVIIALKQYRLYHSNDTASLAWLQVSLFTWLAIPV